MSEEKRVVTKSDAMQGVNIIGSKSVEVVAAGGVKIVGGGPRPDEVTIIDKHPEKK